MHTIIALSNQSENLKPAVSTYTLTHLILDPPDFLSPFHA